MAQTPVWPEALLTTSSSLTTWNGSQVSLCSRVINSTFNICDSVVVQIVKINFYSSTIFFLLNVLFHHGAILLNAYFIMELLLLNVYFITCNKKEYVAFHKQGLCRV